MVRCGWSARGARYIVQIAPGSYGFSAREHSMPPRAEAYHGHKGLDGALQHEARVPKGL
jgi:hypothetical protein